MTDETIDLEDEERDALAQLVAKALLEGESRDSVVADLCNNGIPEDEAEELVDLVELQLFQVEVDHSPTVSGGEGNWGWLIWIVVIVGFRILQALF